MVSGLSALAFDRNRVWNQFCATESNKIHRWLRISEKMNAEIGSDYMNLNVLISSCTWTWLIRISRVFSCDVLKIANTESWVWPSIPRPRTSAQLMSEQMPLNQFSHHIRFGLCPSHRRKAKHTHCTGESDSQLTTRHDRVQQLEMIRIDDSSNSICRRRTVTCILLCNLQLQLLFQFKYREIDNCFSHNNVDNRNNWLPNRFPLSKCVCVCVAIEMIAIDSCRLCVRNYFYRFVCLFVRTRTPTPLPLLHAVSITHCVFYFHRCHQLNWFSTVSLSQPNIYFSSLSSYEKSHELIFLFRKSWHESPSSRFENRFRDHKITTKRKTEKILKKIIYSNQNEWNEENQKWKKEKNNQKMETEWDKSNWQKLIGVHVHDVICKCKWWY